MKVRDVKNLLSASILSGETYLDKEVLSACGADLMSDVLTFVKEKTVLLTGLVNPHVIRTSEMLDVVCIVFVRGKRPTQDILDMADDIGVVVLSTQDTLYTACGKLYMSGLPGGSKERDTDE